MDRTDPGKRKTFPSAPDIDSRCNVKLADNPGMKLVRMIGALAVIASTSLAQEPLGIRESTALFIKGDFDACLTASAAGMRGGRDFPAFAALEVATLLETGRYPEALAKGSTHWRRAPFQPELALAFSRALIANGKASQAEAITNQVIQIQPEAPVAGNSRAAVAYGELLLATKSDAKTVLQRIFEPAMKADPGERAAYLAIGRLALEHHDRELSAEIFREGLKRFPNDPDFALGMEKSGVELPREARDPANGILTWADVALRENPEHGGSLLHKAARHGGMKDFAAAEKMLERLLAVNPDHPEAWAMRAAFLLLIEKKDEAEKALSKARKHWRSNPRVSEIVGETLAGQYRFAEALVHLKRACDEDPDSPSIRLLLGSNQLRFGQLDEGWENVARAHDLDPYNVEAFNLITLRDKLAGFPVREKDGVRLRMSPEDMAVFGDRALEMAVRAKRTLAAKYQIKLSQPVMLEMLPKQEDFAIRTFGLPGGESFLGVCFGPLITMTSPRGRLGRANWESVIWHEMAHTITLEASRHRMPRWLSEGISVYEERLARPGWGQGMTSEYRERILSGDIPPIAELDGLFAGPDIMLGYYQASLVAEFLTERFGIGAMRSVLSDLASGLEVGKALEKRTLPMNELEPAFLEFARKKAEAYGPKFDWRPLTDEEYVEYRKAPETWLASRSERYAAAMMRISDLAKSGKWSEVRPLVETIISSEPENREPFNPYQVLAAACKALDDEPGERAALTKLLEIDANASEAAARLLQLGGSQSAPVRLADADRMLETNPFQEQAYRTIFAEAKESGDLTRARAACVSLLALEPRDSSRIHFELAVLLKETDRNEARREVLKALEENPRFESALEFLVLMNDPS